MDGWMDRLKNMNARIVKKLKHAPGHLVSAFQNLPAALYLLGKR